MFSLNAPSLVPLLPAVRGPRRGHGRPRRLQRPGVDHRDVVAPSGGGRGGRRRIKDVHSAAGQAQDIPAGTLNAG